MSRSTIAQGSLVDPASLRRAQPEADFQRQVIDLARRCGWMVWHDNDSRRNAAGLSDLILIRDRVLWRELKGQKGKVSPEQLRFMARLLWAGQDVKVWRPDDWAEIEKVLM